MPQRRRRKPPRPLPRPSPSNFTRQDGKLTWQSLLLTSRSCATPPARECWTPRRPSPRPREITRRPSSCSASPDSRKPPSAQTAKQPTASLLAGTGSSSSSPPRPISWPRTPSSSGWATRLSRPSPLLAPRTWRRLRPPRWAPRMSRRRCRSALWRALLSSVHWPPLTRGDVVSPIKCSQPY